MRTVDTGGAVDMMNQTDDAPCRRRTGRLGAEQRVSDDTAGEPSKPAPIRLKNGAVLLQYAEITKRDANGLPSEQVIRSLLLQGDAPAAR